MTTLPPRLHPSTRAKLIARLEKDLALSQAIRKWAAEARAEIAEALKLSRTDERRMVTMHSPVCRLRCGAYFTRSTDQ